MENDAANKDCYLDYIIESEGAVKWIKENPFLLPNLYARQMDSYMGNPWFILQYVREIDRLLTANGFPDTEIRAVSLVSLNDRPYQILIDPSVDLTDVDYSIVRVPDWIIPLDSSLKQDEIPLSIEDRLTSIQAGIEHFRRKNPEKSVYLKDYVAKTSPRVLNAK